MYACVLKWTKFHCRKSMLLASLFSMVSQSKGKNSQLILTNSIFWLVILLSELITVTNEEFAAPDIDDRANSEVTVVIIICMNSTSLSTKITRERHFQWQKHCTMCITTDQEHLTNKSWRLGAWEHPGAPPAIESQFLDGDHSYGWQILAAQGWAPTQQGREAGTQISHYSN